MAAAEDQMKALERERVMMSDLSRIRQEELPLSRKENKGPTFAPTRKNGTDHIPAANKERWKNQWAVTFDDEEARQVEGLAFEDSRPYAKAAQVTVSSNNPRMIFDLPARPSPRPSPRPVSLAQHLPGLGKKNKGRATSTAASDTGSAMGSWSSRRQRANQATRPAASNNKPVSAGTKSAVAAAKDFLKNVTRSSPKPTKRPKSPAKPAPKPTAAAPTLASCVLKTHPPMLNGPAAKKDIIYSGYCQIVPMKGDDRPFFASFLVKQVVTNAELELSAAGKPARKHRLRDLAISPVQGPLCIISTPSDVLHIRMKDDKETTSLRQALRLFGKAAPVVSTPSTGTLESATISISPSKPPMPLVSVPPAESPVEPGPVPGTLIEFDEDSESGPQGSGSGRVDLDAVMKQLGAIAERFIPAIIKAGIEVTDPMKSGVDEVVVSSWVDHQDSIGAHALDPSTRAALKAVLEGLLRLRQSIAMRAASPPTMMSSSAMAELMELMQPAYLRYSDAELLRLRDRGVLRQDGEAAVLETKKESKAFAAAKPKPARVDIALDEAAPAGGDVVAEDNMDALTRRAAGLTLGDGGARRGLKSSLWSRDDKIDPPLFVLPGRASAAVPIVMDALAKLDAEEAAPVVKPSPLKGPAVKKGLAASKWA